MEISEVDDRTLHVYLNLCQAYEAEFSAMTGKVPDADGMFALDTVPGGPVRGYLLRSGGAPVGFAAVRTTAGEGSEVCEFYVVPSVRGKCLGKEFACRLFAMHPGPWQVKQLPAAGHATCFWCRVIDEFTGCRYDQDEFDDPYWGRVVRQCFVSPPSDGEG